MVSYGPLHAGAVFSGLQRSGRSSYAVTVTISTLDAASGTLSGTLSIQDLTPSLKELTTWFEGEIIDEHEQRPGHGGFETKRWGATQRDDARYWGRFASYRQFIKSRLLGLTKAGSGPAAGMDEAGERKQQLFMRWKELGVVPDRSLDADGTSHHNSEEMNINGASFAGFYYLCLEFNSPPMPAHSPPAFLANAGFPRRSLSPLASPFVRSVESVGHAAMATRNGSSTIGSRAGMNNTATHSSSLPSTMTRIMRSASNPIIAVPAPSLVSPADITISSPAVAIGSNVNNRVRARRSTSGNSSYAEVLVRGISPLLTDQRGGRRRRVDENAIDSDESEGDEDAAYPLSIQTRFSPPKDDGSRAGSTSLRYEGGSAINRAIAIPLPMEAKEEDFPAPVSPSLSASTSASSSVSSSSSTVSANRYYGRTSHIATDGDGEAAGGSERGRSLRDERTTAAQGLQHMLSSSGSASSSSASSSLSTSPRSQRMETESTRKRLIAEAESRSRSRPGEDMKGRKREDWGNSSWAAARITGFYFHINSEPYQELSLDYVVGHRGGTEEFSFC